MFDSIALPSLVMTILNLGRRRDKRHAEREIKTYFRNTGANNKFTVWPNVFKRSDFKPPWRSNVTIQIN